MVLQPTTIALVLRQGGHSTISTLNQVDELGKIEIDNTEKNKMPLDFPRAWGT